MRFRRDAELDPGQVTDVRGRGVGPGGVAVGAGGLGAIGLVVYLLIALLSGGGGLGQLGPLDNQQVGQGDTPAEVSSDCRTGEQANTRQDCRIVAVVNSVQRFWAGAFQRSDRQYQNVNTVFFTDQVQTGCGFASSQVGPFYCPHDKQVYIDLGFFDELQSRFKAPGDFAEAYVVTHEIGHHIQQELGIEQQVRQESQANPDDANELSVRLELQADCLAGVWARSTYDRGLLESGDLQEGLTAAAAVGDDRIQQQAQGRIDPETFTHGTSEQRAHWLQTGFDSGRLEACDTFSGDI